MCARSQLNKASRPVRGIDGLRVKQSGQLIEGIAELLPRDAMSAPRVGDVGKRFPQQPDVIFQSGEQVSSNERFLNQLAATAAHGQKIAGEISAVHRGNILGLEG